MLPQRSAKFGGAGIAESRPELEESGQVAPRQDDDDDGSVSIEIVRGDDTPQASEQDAGKAEKDATTPKDEPL